MKNKILSLLLILIIFSSCKNENAVESASKKTYFIGKIINPVDSIIQLFSVPNIPENYLTASLNNDGEFIFELDSLDGNLYHFQHGREEQEVFLENGDSLSMRLDTDEFDESIVYSGNGSSVNNYLIKKYLDSEKSSISMIYLYSQDENNFNHIVDSLKNKEIEFVSKFNYDNSFSKTALEYVKKKIFYSIYGMKELYPFSNTAIKKKENITQVDRNFYNYRKNLNLNDSSLTKETFYNKYIYYRILNASYNKLFSVVDDGEYIKNKIKYQKQLVQYRINCVDSLISNENVKNKISYHIALSLFDFNFEKQDLNNFLNQLNIDSLSDFEKKNILKYKIKYFNLEKGSRAPDFKVSDGKKEFNFSKYFGKPIYLYFWLSANKEKYSSWDSDQTKEYNRLKKLYPNVQFISVFLDYEDLWEVSKKKSETNGIQLVADYDDLSSKYLISSRLTFVLIDKNGNIIESNARWPSSKEIKIQLEKLNNN